MFVGCELEVCSTPQCHRATYPIQSLPPSSLLPPHQKNVSAHPPSQHTTPPPRRLASPQLPYRPRAQKLPLKYTKPQDRDGKKKARVHARPQQSRRSLSSPLKGVLETSAPENKACFFGNLIFRENILSSRNESCPELHLKPRGGGVGWTRVYICILVENMVCKDGDKEE